MSRILILARNHREACEMAERYELSPREWRGVAGWTGLLGYRRPQVIATWCWWEGRETLEVDAIGAEMFRSDALVAYVPCRVDEAC